MRPSRSGLMSLFNDLYGQRVQALVNEILQCIIHKPVACHAALACKGRAGDAHPKVSTETFCVGARVTRMGRALVKYLKERRRKPKFELLLQRLHVDGQHRAHGVVPGLMCLFR